TPPSRGPASRPRTGACGRARRDVARTPAGHPRGGEMEDAAVLEGARPAWDSLAPALRGAATGSGADHVLDATVRRSTAGERDHEDHRNGNPAGRACSRARRAHALG